MGPGELRYISVGTVMAGAFLCLCLQGAETLAPMSDSQGPHCVPLYGRVLAGNELTEAGYLVELADFEPGFRVPPDKASHFAFPVGKTAKELRGKLTASEVADIADSREVWDRLKKPDSVVKAGADDVVVYPSSGVDFGLPINVFEGARLYMGVDVVSTFSQEQIRAWAKDPSFDVSKLFSERKFVKTIPYMESGAAGDGPQFAKSYLKNLATVLPDNAMVESVTFILDHQPGTSYGDTQNGTHILVTWKHLGRRQSALLISDPMPSPEKSPAPWWFDEMKRLKPAYAVMKRPQNFSFNEVFGLMTKWVRHKGGMILSEGNTQDSTTEGEAAANLKGARYKRHEVTAKDLGREGVIFGFDDTAVLVEVFGPQR